MSSISDDIKKVLIKRVFRKMKDIPHLNSFILERGSVYATKFISETIDVFYEAISCTLNSKTHSEVTFDN
jgi:hypothetical protein